MVTFYQFVQPALARMAGQTEPVNVLFKATAATALKKRPGRMEFQRGILEHRPDGALVVHGTGDQGSGVLSCSPTKVPVSNLVRRLTYSRSRALFRRRYVDSRAGAPR